LIARLDGVEWAVEDEHGSFLVALRTDKTRFQRDLEALAAQNGATFESCEPASQE